MQDSKIQEPERLHPSTIKAIGAFEQAAKRKQEADDLISETISSVPSDEILDYLMITDQIQENYTT